MMILGKSGCRVATHAGTIRTFDIERSDAFAPATSEGGTTSERDGRVGPGPQRRTSLHGRGRARRLRHRRRRRQGRETVGRGAAESRHRPQVHGTPRRRLRRRRRRRRPHDRHPAGVPQGRGQAAQVRRRPRPQARGHARGRRRLPRTTATRRRSSRPARSIREALRGGPVQLLGFRPVPTNDDVAARDGARLPGRPRSSRCCFNVDGRRRRRPSGGSSCAGSNSASGSQAAGLTRLHPVALGASSSATRGCSPARSSRTSTRTCTNPAFETGIAIFHRRYSTNTFPNWTLAQPFRLHLPQRRDQHHPHEPQRGLRPSPAG